jgi:hypothetical protein
MSIMLNAVRTKTGDWLCSVGGRVRVVAARPSVALKASSALGMLAASAFANAALDAAVTDLLTDLGADVALLFAACVTLWATIRGFVAVFKLGNKFISKAGA